MMIRDDIKEWIHDEVFIFLYNEDYNGKPKDCKLTSDITGDSVIIEFRSIHGNITCTVFTKKKLVEGYYEMQGVSNISTSNYINGGEKYMSFIEYTINVVFSALDNPYIKMEGDITSEVYYYSDKNIDDVTLEKYYDRTEDYDKIYFDKHKTVYKEKITNIADIPFIILDDILVNHRMVLLKIYGCNEYLDLNIEYSLYIKKSPSMVGTDQITIFAISSEGQGIRDINNALTLFESYNNMIKKRRNEVDDDNYLLLQTIVSKAISSVFENFKYVIDGKPKYKIYMV